MDNYMESQQLRDYRTLFRIRNFENTILDLFSQNKLTGTTHTCIGQEACPVALMDYLEEKDYIFGSHRSHGYLISYAKTTQPLMAEIMGKKSGMCKGRGGSQHICYKHYRSNGVQGGIVPNATGMALAEKYKKSGAIVVALLGDGTMGQGVVYESMNMASIYGAPVLYIIEDNGYAMTTPSSYAVAGDLKTRVEGFGLRVNEITSNDVDVLRPFFEDATQYVRENQKPMCCIIRTYRLGPHSKSDDTRDPAEIASHQQNDPLLIAEKKIDAEIAQTIQNEEIAALNKVIEICEADSIETLADIDSSLDERVSSASIFSTGPTKKCVVELNAALDSLLKNDETAIVLGEDIRDPYGGAFKATKGLSEFYDNRILNTPISEAGMVGLGVGMAMQGMHPIVEMMFGDFLSLTFDQLLNHAAKYNWVYDGQISVPLLVRAPMGGKRGYGATHSQSLEKFLLGIPGLDTVAISPLHNIAQLMHNIYSGLDKPTVLIEDKALYGQRMLSVQDGMCGDFFVQEDSARYPIMTLSMDEGASDVAIITYGGMTKDAMDAAEMLMMRDEIIAKVVVVTKLNNINYEHLCEYVNDAQTIVTVEPGTNASGWGAEVISNLAMRLKGKQFKRIATLDYPVPCNKTLENEMIPNAQSIYNTIKS